MCPSQTLLSDIVMSAGGLGATGDMKRTKVFRGNEEIMDPKAVNLAIANGATLDLMNLQSGDNVNIGVQQPAGHAQQGADHHGAARHPADDRQHLSNIQLGCPRWDTR